MNKELREKIERDLMRGVRELNRLFVKAINKKLYPYKGAREDAISKIERKTYE